jgi:integrase
MIKQWDTAVKRVKLKRLTPHSGRHGFATGILRKGVDPKTGAWLGGWKSIRHFMETYAHAIQDITLNEKILGTPVTQDEVEIKEKPVKSA